MLLLVLVYQVKRLRCGRIGVVKMGRMSRVIGFVLEWGELYWVFSCIIKIIIIGIMRIDIDIKSIIFIESIKPIADIIIPFQSSIKSSSFFLW